MTRKGGKLWFGTRGTWSKNPGPIGARNPLMCQCKVEVPVRLYGVMRTDAAQNRTMATPASTSILARGDTVFMAATTFEVGGGAK